MRQKRGRISSTGSSARTKRARLLSDSKTHRDDDATRIRESLERGDLNVFGMRSLIMDALRVGGVDLSPYEPFIRTEIFWSPIHCTGVSVVHAAFAREYEPMLVRCRAWLWYEHASSWYTRHFMEHNPYHLYFIRLAVLDECVRSGRMPRRYLIRSQDAVDTLVAHHVEFSRIRCGPGLCTHDTIRRRRLAAHKELMRKSLVKHTDLPYDVIGVISGYVYTELAKPPTRERV
jgi:hypothetical protein